jgi:hypothetical protein
MPSNGDWRRGFFFIEVVSSLELWEGIEPRLHGQVLPVVQVMFSGQHRFPVAFQRPSLRCRQTVLQSLLNDRHGFVGHSGDVELVHDQAGMRHYCLSGLPVVLAVTALAWGYVWKEGMANWDEPRFTPGHETNITIHAGKLSRVNAQK